jgi:hypothetical protein
MAGLAHLEAASCDPRHGDASAVVPAQPLQRLKVIRGRRRIEPNASPRHKMNSTLSASSCSLPGVSSACACGNRRPGALAGRSSRATNRRTSRSTAERGSAALSNRLLGDRHCCSHGRRMNSSVRTPLAPRPIRRRHLPAPRARRSREADEDQISLEPPRTPLRRSAQCGRPAHFQPSKAAAASASNTKTAKRLVSRRCTVLPPIAGARSRDPSDVVVAVNGPDGSSARPPELRKGPIPASAG